MRKNEQGKLHYIDISAYSLKEIAKVFEYGAKKYDRKTWVQGNREDNQNKILDAMLRHIQAHRLGELFDKDSGLLHTSHVLANAIMLVDNDIKRGEVRNEEVKT